MPQEDRIKKNLGRPCKQSEQMRSDCWHLSQLHYQTRQCEPSNWLAPVSSAILDYSQLGGQSTVAYQHAPGIEAAPGGMMS